MILHYDLQSCSDSQAASLSKPVFAYAVLKLVAQGKLALDAPIVKYLPQGYRHQFNPLKVEPTDWVTAPRIQAVTVRMALNHTSGLPNWSSGPLSFDEAITFPDLPGFGVGSGWAVYSEVLHTVLGKRVMGVSNDVYPSAGAIAQLGAADFVSGFGVSVEQAMPVYLRNKVAKTLAERV